jgi:hypothetical protein
MDFDHFPDGSLQFLKGDRGDPHEQILPPGLCRYFDDLRNAAQLFNDMT